MRAGVRSSGGMHRQTTRTRRGGQTLVQQRRPLFPSCFGYLFNEPCGRISGGGQKAWATPPPRLQGVESNFGLHEQKDRTQGAANHANTREHVARPHDHSPPEFRRPCPAAPPTLCSRRGYKKNGLDPGSSPPPTLPAENLRIRPATSLAVTGSPRLASTWESSA